MSSVTLPMMPKVSRRVGGTHPGHIQQGERHPPLPTDEVVLAALETTRRIKRGECELYEALRRYKMLHYAEYWAAWRVLASTLNDVPRPISVSLIHGMIVDRVKVIELRAGLPPRGEK